MLFRSVAKRQHFPFSHGNTRSPSLLSFLTRSTASTRFFRISRCKDKRRSSRQTHSSLLIEAINRRTHREVASSHRLSTLAAATPRTPRRPSRRRRSAAFPSSSPSLPRSCSGRPSSAGLCAQSTSRRTRRDPSYLTSYTTGHRRSQYHPRVKALCQEGAYHCLPFHQKEYLWRKMSCPDCKLLNCFTQHIAFKERQVVEWVRSVGTLTFSSLSYLSITHAAV